MPWKFLQNLAKLGDIPKHLAKVSPPTCAGCLFGSMTRQPRPGYSKAKDTKVFKATKPGQCVSVDQMISTQVGFIAQLKGRLTTARYKGATVFVDHFSRVRYIYLMRSQTSAETIQAKRAFERWASDYGVTIRHYHCDNGRFADNAFIAACEQQRQTITFCGVNAHHQNGIAERAIRDIQDQARKQLLHAKARWTKAIDLALWPYALRYAVYVHNTVPYLQGKNNGKSRLELFSGIRIAAKLSQMHTFGCPVYALQNELASGNSLPKWSPRARLGINLGPSPDHARSVYNVLNPTTGLVSPQYHVKFDDLFESIRYSQVERTATYPWKTLARLTKVDRGDPSEPMHDIPSIAQRSDARPEQAQEPEYLPSALPQDTRVEQASDLQEELPSDDQVEMQSEHFARPNRSANRRHRQARREEVRPPPVAPITTVSSRGRIRTASRKQMESQGYYADSVAHAELSPDEAHDYHLNLEERMRHPLSFHAEMMGDIMYYHQAMKQDDADKFVEAIVKEVNGHIDNDNWVLVKRSEVPQDQEVVPSVWAMRRKRNLTTNEITKYKARLNVHGGKQTYGVNYFDTYAPVVTWFAIRQFVSSSSLQLYSTGPSSRSTSSWHTLKLLLRMTCTWIYLWVSTPSMEVQKTLYSS
jgi:ribosomal protein L13E